LFFASPKFNITDIRIW